MTCGFPTCRCSCSKASRYTSQRRLGHSLVVMLSVYAKMTGQADEQAAASFGSLFTGGR